MNAKLLFKIIFVCLFIVSVNPQVIDKNITLMPYPLKVEYDNQDFRLSHSFTICLEGKYDVRLNKAASRFLQRLKNRTGLFFSQGVITDKTNPKSANLIIKCNRPAKIELYEDESYQLKISQNKIEIFSETDKGAMYAIETLLQTLKADASGYYFPGYSIDDKPRFPWRGLMIDVSRHFVPIDVLKRNIDGLAAVKMNVFHWHLSDDQGVRVESKVFPQIQELASDGYYYTQIEILDIINYAAERGIRVVPEFDVPGHSSAFLTAFPELGSIPRNYEIERNWGIFNPTFDPTNEKTYEFFDKFFGEMAKLFPDPFFHIGGDENNGKDWDSSKTIQKFKKENNIKDNHELQAYFNRRLNEILKKYNKRMMGWDEILHPGISSDIMIQSWRGTKSLKEAAKKGYLGILSNGYYIDLIQSAEFHYLNDPKPDSLNLTEEEGKLILGGEATSWAELVTYETIDSRIWPRTAVIAERLWSPAFIRDVDFMYERSKHISYLLEEHGLLHKKNYEMMLRRLTGNREVSHLKTLVDILEPVKIYQRHFQGVKYTSFSPYSRIVDAARPESETARKFKILLSRYKHNSDSSAFNEIKNYLYIWKNNHQKLLKDIEVSPIIKEIEPLSELLSKISEKALDCIDYIAVNKPIEEDWKKEFNRLILEAKKPCGQTELMVASLIEEFVKLSFKP